MGVKNNICTALNHTYLSLLKFAEKFEFDNKQKRYIENLKLNLEIALPFGKYTTSKLEDCKKIEDPTYKNQKQFFEDDKNYIEDMYKEIEKLKDEYKKYEVEEIDVDKFFSEPINSYRKYELVKNYEEAYKITMLLRDSLNEEQKNHLKDFIKKLENCFYMSYRMCRKLEDYKKKYPFNGDIGIWEKDKKMKDIKYHSERFRKINEGRLR